MCLLRFRSESYYNFIIKIKIHALSLFGVRSGSGYYRNCWVRAWGVTVLRSGGFLTVSRYEKPGAGAQGQFNVCVSLPGKDVLKNGGAFKKAWGSGNDYLLPGVWHTIHKLHKVFLGGLWLLIFFSVFSPGLHNDWNSWAVVLDNLQSGGCTILYAGTCITKYGRRSPWCAGP